MRLEFEDRCKGEGAEAAAACESLDGGGKGGFLRSSVSFIMLKKKQMKSLSYSEVICGCCTTMYVCNRGVAHVGYCFVISSVLFDYMRRKSAHINEA